MKVKCPNPKEDCQKCRHAVEHEEEKLYCHRRCGPYGETCANGDQPRADSGPDDIPGEMWSPLNPPNESPGKAKSHSETPFSFDHQDVASFVEASEEED